MGKTIYECREELTAAIDRGEWKNSWHLPKDENGYIGWFKEETAKKVQEVLHEEFLWAFRVAARARRLLDEIDWGFYRDDQGEAE